MTQTQEKVPFQDHEEDDISDIGGREVDDDEDDHAGEGQQHIDNAELDKLMEAED
jgi:hypothetical protein